MSEGTRGTRVALERGAKAMIKDGVLQHPSALSTTEPLSVANDRQMTLTPELVARVHRAVEDTGPEQGVSYHKDEDYDACVRTILAQRGSAPPIWLFAYGSLIWKPEIQHVEERAGTARGWHRSFCLRQTRWRGTK